MPDDQDWRLKAELSVNTGGGLLDRVLHRARSGDVVDELGKAVPHDAAITHDGNMLFAYAASKDSLESARAAIETALRRDGIDATFLVSHWDDQIDGWLQVDPPLAGEAKRAEQAAEHDAERLESRTMIVTAGKLVRAEVEQTMRDWASKLGLECQLIEHPHLLTTQVAFTVTGPKRKIDEFAEGLKAEELATLRTERAVMLSPL